MRSWLTTVAIAASWIARAQNLSISGDIPSPVVLSASELRAMPHTKVTMRDPHKEATAVYDGVPLSEILKRAHLPAGPELRGKSLASYLLVKAKDDYEVVYSLAELDSAFRDTTIIVADQVDGKSLDEHEGPLRLVNTSDKKPARSVRMLTELQIVFLRK